MSESYYDFARILGDATSPSTGSSNRTGVIDDLEDSDLQEYQNVVGDISISQASVFEGSYSVEVSSSDSSGDLTYSLAGLDRYPQAGDTFQYQFWADNSAAGGGIVFGVQDSQSWYKLGFRPTLSGSSRSNYITKYENGSYTGIASNNDDIPVGEWLTIEVDWGEGGSISVSVIDSSGNSVTSLSGVDATFVDGGFGYIWQGIAGGGTQYYDLAKITATTSGTGTIDDFEGGDISAYTQVDNGDGFFVGTQTSTVYEGTYALELRDDDGKPAISSLSGLPRYPQAGDTFSFRWRYQDGSDVGMLIFGAQSESDFADGYLVRSTQSDTYELQIGDGGSYTLLDETSFTRSNYTNEWLKTTIDWGSGGSIDVTLEDSTGNTILTLSATDSTHSGGGINWQKGSGSTTKSSVFFDLAEISSSGDQTETGIVDGFEDGTLSEYSIYNSAQVEVLADAAYEGSYGLKLSDADPSSGRIISTSGLPRYPEAGDTFEVWMKYATTDSNDVDNTFFFGSQSESEKPDGYRVIVGSNNDGLILQKRDGSTVTTISSTNTDYSQYGWIRVVVEWGANGSITVTSHDSSGAKIESITGTDTQYDSGGIGFLFFDATSGTNSGYFDSFKII